MTTDPRCCACDLSSGRAPLIGGRVFESDHWLVEHCMGPLGVGTLILTEMFRAGGVPEREAIEAFCDQARRAFERETS